MFFSFKMGFFTKIKKWLLLILKKFPMDYILYIVQYVNILTLCITISIGIRSLKSLKQNKILLIIPILSLFQIVFSEILKIIFRSRYNITIQSIVLVNIYTSLEFTLIITFFWKLTQTRKENIIIFSPIIFTLISLLAGDILNIAKDLISFETFLFVEGAIILLIAIYYLIKFMRIKNQSNYFQDSNFISTLGIFLSFLVLWPANISQKYFLKHPNTFYDFLFIANSTAYIIFFSFLSYSFYVTRK